MDREDELAATRDALYSALDELAAYTDLSDDDNDLATVEIYRRTAR